MLKEATSLSVAKIKDISELQLPQIKISHYIREITRQRKSYDDSRGFNGICHLHHLPIESNRSYQLVPQLRLHFDTPNTAVSEKMTACYVLRDTASEEKNVYPIPKRSRLILELIELIVVQLGDPKFPYRLREVEVTSGIERIEAARGMRRSASTFFDALSLGGIDWDGGKPITERVLGQ